MLKSKVFVAAALAVAIGPLGHAQGSKGAPALSAADREEIRVLNAKYSLALGQCDPDHWPLVFAADGFFASMGRGRVLGQHRLGEMNRSYDCVYIDGKAQDHAPTVAVPYKIELTATKEGAEGFAYYNGGRYEDVYVKTKDGWRFKSRTVVGNREQAAGFALEGLRRRPAPRGRQRRSLRGRLRTVGARQALQVCQCLHLDGPER